MQNSISSLVRAHWKRFAWMWAFPMLLFSSLLFPAFSQHPLRFFFVVHCPMLTVCAFMASKPIRDGHVPFAKGFVIIAVLPFAIWSVLVFGLLGLVALFRMLEG